MENLDAKESEKGMMSGMKTALEHAEKKNAGWGTMAMFCLMEYPKDEFMVEDVRVWAYDHGLPPAPHDRAWGAIIMNAARQGIVVKTGFRNVKNPKAHRTPASVWKRI